MISPPGGINIGAGHVLRHTPAVPGGQGREAALVDIAQDLVLRHLHGESLLDKLVFKGGTALRKLYAGRDGRFSLDLDFAVRDVDTVAEFELDALEEAVTGLRLGPFTYGFATKRGKRLLQMSSATLGMGETLESKLDVSAPPWLEPLDRGWVTMPVHQQYGSPPLPKMSVVRLEENLAEKIARLNQRTPARDMYDLRWVARNELLALDVPLIRRLAVLKIWVDTNALGAASGTSWRRAHEGGPFDPAQWLRARTGKEYDEEDIGVLAVPPPNLADLSREVSARYGFLADLTPEERLVAGGRASQRGLVLKMLADLPGGRMANIGLH